MTLKSVFLFPLIALTMLGALAACETVKGAGEDIETAGQAVGNAAEEAED
ncbi:MAG: entericidin A/B family lipoprotein [Pseudomonadota bacterium]|nr:entericidin A/B family lipoprotein [Roseovarius sp. EGI FJ00037]MCZ0812649.1 entericidin A/B family lipoprotein [Roseovarius sp. EGI FJ00037]